MADFMTVLAASQGAQGGKAAASASGRMPAGFFSELLSAQFEASAEPLLSLPAPVSGEWLKLTATPGLAADGEPSLTPGEEGDAGSDSALPGVFMPLFNPVTTELTPAPASPAAPEDLEGQSLPRLSLQSADDKAARAARDTTMAAHLSVQAEWAAGSDKATEAAEAAEAASPALVAAAGKSEAMALMATGREALAPAGITATKLPPGKLAPDDPSLLGVNRPAAQFDLRGAEAAPRLGIAAPVQGRAFPAEFAEKVVWMAGQQMQSAELSLNPQHLGSVEIRLSVAGGEAGAQFYSPHPAVRDAIEAALPKLRELLAQAGISLGDTQVRDESFRQREERPSSQAAASGNAGQSATVGVMPVTSTVRSGVGLVDLYA